MRLVRRRLVLPLTLPVALALLVGVVVGLVPAKQAAAAPSVRVTQVVGGLSVPWDVTWVGETLLFDQRAGGVWSKRGDANPRRVSMSMPAVYARGESGLLGLVADPDAARNRYFYTCLAVERGGAPVGVEVWKWRLRTDRQAERVRRLVRDIPLNSSGRHSGCRLRFRSASMLYIGTGDAAQGTNPQDLSSLGGKVLRVRSDGHIPSSNPFYSRGGNARYVWTYGHRNLQGLIKRPGRNEMWSVEHGSTRDDEVNRLVKGRNFGWDPTPGAYDESRPMTDRGRYPQAVNAAWRSGQPTVATSGGTFISGSHWGTWNGLLAVGMLKGQGVRLFTVDPAGRITGSERVLTGYGRIRTVQQGPDGALYFTTSNVTNDGIYKVAVS